jgi:hypothetical protein
MATGANTEQSFRYQQVMLAGIVATPQASDPLPAGSSPHIYFNSTDSRWHAVNSDVDYVIPLSSSSPGFEPVRLASSAAITGTYVAGVLTQTSTGALSVDGVAVAVGDRVLLKDQASGSQNGIYVVTVAGTTGVSAVLTRASDANVTRDFEPGKLVGISNEGTANLNQVFQLTCAKGAVLDTDSMTFAVPKASTFKSNAVTGPALSATSLRLLAFAGHSGAGACTATGTKVGDTVVGIIDLAAASVSAAASFESTITVNDQIQQSSASNLSAVKYALIVVAKS